MHQRLADNPVIAVLASSTSALIAEIVAGPLSTLTQFCAAGTGVLVFLFWLRKFAIQAMHDFRDFRRGKLPKVDATEPGK